MIGPLLSYSRPSFRGTLIPASKETEVGRFRWTTDPGYTRDGVPGDNLFTTIPT